MLTFGYEALATDYCLARAGGSPAAATCKDPYETSCNRIVQEHLSRPSSAWRTGRRSAAVANQSRARVTGDLVGKSTAELLACTSGPDRFGYVGVDRFTGRLKGRSGSFVFQHGGMHDKGTLRPFGYVVAGSGTDELKGLLGEVKISVTPAGAHTIELDYDFE